MIYSRFGSKVTITGPVTTLDQVKALSGLIPDQHDRDRLAFGMYATAVFHNDGDCLGDRLVDLALLRADGGIAEINAAARAVGCQPK